MSQFVKTAIKFISVIHVLDARHCSLIILLAILWLGYFMVIILTLVLLRLNNSIQMIFPYLYMMMKSICANLDYFSVDLFFVKSVL